MVLDVHILVIWIPAIHAGMTTLINFQHYANSAFLRADSSDAAGKLAMEGLWERLFLAQTDAEKYLLIPFPVLLGVGA
ncbi:hypothetical protein [Methylicorpusculum sp.]|uniref:hypothetical protein n=1 Tax=Methylicorpusculum sp. TaxID=2713644 RepID=UPI00271D9D44|nr:hypothetical protein [Methylicorpusculum sp.]MDO8846521.1 hypothetical protein [Methylicorpusculum sp.]